jgi:hypothetical protein
MLISSTKKPIERSAYREEFRPLQGADFVEDSGQLSESDGGTDVGNFRAKSVLFGVGMEALSSSVDEALALREKEESRSRFRDLTRIFKPRLEFESESSEFSANTTGDSVDLEKTFLIAKKDALIQIRNGRPHIQVDFEGKKTWIPQEAFSDVDEAFYLPTFKSSPLTAAVSGGAKTLLTFGPVAALAASASGFAAHKVVDDPRAKFALSAGLGAALFAATDAVFGGHLGLGTSLLVGASAGVLGVHAGEGRARVRDAAYSGGLASFGTLPLTHDPTLGLHSAAAAGLGARAKTPEVRALLSGATGAALGALHAVVTGQPVGLLAGLTATTSVAGSLAGPTVMQASRNISHSSGEVIGKVLRKAPDPVLKFVGTVPVAAGMGFVGAAAGLIIPGAGAIGAIFGTLGGAALGHQQTESKLEAAKAEPSNL